MTSNITASADRFFEIIFCSSHIYSRRHQAPMPRHRVRDLGILGQIKSSHGPSNQIV